MITSSNFFKKTFFGDFQDESPTQKRVGPWLQQKYQTIEKTPSPVSFVNRVKYAQMRSKRSKKKVELPIITSKRLEIGPLDSVYPALPLLKKRKTRETSTNSIPQTYRSLDLRKIAQKRLSGSVHKGSNVSDQLKQVNSLQRKGEVIRILGLPTTHFYF